MIKFPIFQVKKLKDKNNNRWLKRRKNKNQYKKIKN